MIMTCQCPWWRKPEYPEEPNDLRQVTDETFTHIRPMHNPTSEPGPRLGHWATEGPPPSQAKNKRERERERERERDEDEERKRDRVCIYVTETEAGGRRPPNSPRLCGSNQGYILRVARRPVIPTGALWVCDGHVPLAAAACNKRGRPLDYTT